MLLIPLYAAIVGVAICRPEANDHTNITSPMETFTEEEMQEWASFMEIMRDTDTTKEQKLEKIQAKLANESSEEVKYALEQSELAIDLSEWMADKVKSASTKVKELFYKILDLLSDIKFLGKTPQEKTEEIESMLKPLSDSEKKELEELDKMNREKANELGIQLPEKMQKRR